MPFVPVEIPPGVFGDLTPYGAEGKWRSSNRIRFRDGLPEPIGGWQKLLSAALAGTPRGMHSWAQIDGTIDAAIGTTTKLYVIEGGISYDVTPNDETGTLGNNPLTTVNTLATVTVADTAHVRGIGDLVTFSGAAAVGGITIDGDYNVTSITDANSYVITHSSSATSSATGGGASVAFTYELGIGAADALFDLGWGAGAWNDSTWNTARTSADATVDLRTWSFMNFGEDLLASPRGGGLYVWDASGGTGAIATKVAAAPTAELYVLSPDDRHIIALGAGGDPSLIQWSDQGDYTNWTQDSTTTAGQRQLLSGSKIASAVVTKTEILIWTDTTLHNLRYRGGNFTFDLKTIGQSNGMIGINAAIERNGVAFWMANGTFQIYDGVVRDLDCTLLRYVFDSLVDAQADKVVAALYENRHEIWWFYPSTFGTGEVDLYVKYNWKDDAWDHGSLDRTFWIDGTVFSNPLATDAAGIVYEHELSVYTDENQGALGEFIESGDIDIGSGQEVIYCNRVIPDFVGGPVDLVFKSRMSPGGAQTTYGPFSVESTTENIRPRVRGRRMSLLIDGDSSNVGAYWRMGKSVADIEADGEE